MTGMGNLPDFESANTITKHFFGTTKYITEPKSFPLSLLQSHAFTLSRSFPPAFLEHVMTLFFCFFPPEQGQSHMCMWMC